MIRLIHKSKIRADDYVTIVLVISYLALFLFFRLEWIMSIIIYPFVALFFYGLIKIVRLASKRNRGDDRNLNRVLFGIISIIFSISFLFFILVQPNVTFHLIINLTSFPILIVGFAAIIKGYIIDSYSRNYRVINIILGLITIIICIASFLTSAITPQDYILFHFVAFMILISANVLSRAALYLSEFGLSPLHFRNIIIFFYIISDYSIFINEEGNVFLQKIEL
ncbi:MAG: hypothetical protein ACFFA0_13330 [Promethearchaeota archaeon]